MTAQALVLFSEVPPSTQPVRLWLCETHDCRMDHRSTLDEARVKGWRIWDTKMRRVRALCPICAGNAPEPERGWVARCHTCGWQREQEWVTVTDPAGHPVERLVEMTPQQARDAADDHECEPDVALLPPIGTAGEHPKRGYEPSSVRRDGSIRQQ